MVKVLSVILGLMVFVSCGVSESYVAETLPRESFLFVHQKVLFKACKGEMCTDSSLALVGSGFVIATDNIDSYGVTAGHVCEAPPPPKEIKVTNTIITVHMLGGAKYSAEVVKVYDNVDVCVLLLSGVLLPEMHMSPNPPRTGQKVYNLAAPLGIFTSHMLPVFDGYYNGLNERDWDVYSLPVAGGSSGSPIMDKKGRLLGMVSMKLRGFENISLSPPHAALRDIVNSVKARARARRLSPSLPGVELD